MAEERTGDTYDELRAYDEPKGVERVEEPHHEEPTPRADDDYQETAPELGVLNRDYAGIPGPCQKLTGNALDACVHGDYPANAGMPVKPAK